MYDKCTFKIIQITFHFLIFRHVIHIHDGNKDMMHNMDAIYVLAEITSKCPVENPPECQSHNEQLFDSELVEEGKQKEKRNLDSFKVYRWVKVADVPKGVRIRDCVWVFKQGPKFVADCAYETLQRS